MSTNSGPGYAKHPEHTVTVTPFRGRVVVRVGDDVVADTRDALQLNEASYPAACYVPRTDVRMERLARTDHRTHCPFKGDASYFTITGVAENAVWSYEHPYDEVEQIRDRLAFYPDKVRIDVEPAA
ncbi:MAG TPA: DUF427 domain-containing protein [Nannocystaceae bacterium]|nr:DUF427 domain-containing protein [Nannocystaceae bacterium]